MPGDTVALELDFFASEGDVDLFLLDSSGVEVASSTATADDESISYTVATSGPFYARVVLASDAGVLPGNRYGLALSGTTPTCVPDVYEPNDDSASAWPQASGTWHDLTICPGEDDWYELSLGFLELAVLDLGYEADEGDVDLLLWDDSLASLVASGASADDDEHVEVIVPAGGTYYLQITLVADAGTIPGNTYDRGLVSVLTTTCSPDAFEPNDEPWAAWPLGDGSFSGLTVCAGEPDWYALELSAPGWIDLLAAADPAEGVLGLALYDPSGVFQAASSPAAGGEQILWDAATAGVWTVEVELVADTGPDTGAFYSLAVSLP